MPALPSAGDTLPRGPSSGWLHCGAAPSTRLKQPHPATLSFPPPFSLYFVSRKLFIELFTYLRPSWPPLGSQRPAEDVFLRTRRLHPWLPASKDAESQRLLHPSPKPPPRTQVPWRPLFTPRLPIPDVPENPAGGHGSSSRPSCCTPPQATSSLFPSLASVSSPVKQGR